MQDYSDSFAVKGDVIIIKIDEAGTTEKTEIKNLVVATGKSFITSRMSANTANIMSHMSVGTGSTAAASGDTALGSELARVALSVTGGTPSSNTITYTATFPSGTGTGALTEAGIFNSDNTLTATMLCRTVFPVINKQAGDSIAVTWNISIT